MKKLLKSLFLMLGCFMVLFTFASCTNKGGENPVPDQYTRPTEVNIDDSFMATSNTLIAYFSKTNTTKGVAETIQELTDSDIFEIARKEPYPADYTATTQIAQEEKESNIRPELAIYLSEEVMELYDTIVLGFPIWWHTAPMAVLSFLNYYNLNGKTIYTFATSGGSPISESTADIRNNATGATVVEGKIFSNGDDNNIESWLAGLGLIKEATPINPDPDTPEIQPTESLTFDYPRNDQGVVVDNSFYIVTGMVGTETTIIIPAEHNGIPVTTIGESAFAYSRHNDDILSVTIPDSVTTIERNAFYNRAEMTTVNISQTSRLTTIGNNAFSGNYSLTNIYLPATITSIGESAFNNDGAINFTVEQGNPVYRSENGHLIEIATNTLIRGGQNSAIPQSVKTIAQAAFRNSAFITELVIPTSVTKIGNYFIANSSITSLQFRGTAEEWNAIEKSASMWNYGNREVELKFKTEPNVLIVYFTAESGNTERLANYIHSQISGDIIEIEAAQPYTSQDLNYSIPNNRPEVEKAENARPEISQSTYNQIDISKYDTIFIGYPIWWWTAPMIIGTFLEHYDLTDYNIYPFSQSASMNVTQFDTSMEFVRNCATGAIVHSGLFARATSTTTIDAYLSTNGFINS